MMKKSVLFLLTSYNMSEYVSSFYSMMTIQNMREELFSITSSTNTYIPPIKQTMVTVPKKVANTYHAALEPCENYIIYINEPKIIDAIAAGCKKTDQCRGYIYTDTDMVNCIVTKTSCGPILMVRIPKSSPNIKIRDHTARYAFNIPLQAIGKSASKITKHSSYAITFLKESENTFIRLCPYNTSLSRGFSSESTEIVSIPVDPAKIAHTVANLIGIDSFATPVFNMDVFMNMSVIVMKEMPDIISAPLAHGSSNSNGLMGPSGPTDILHVDHNKREIVYERQDGMTRTRRNIISMSEEESINWAIHSSSTKFKLLPFVSKLRSITNRSTTSAEKRYCILTQYQKVTFLINIVSSCNPFAISLPESFSRIFTSTPQIMEIFACVSI